MTNENEPGEPAFPLQPDVSVITADGSLTLLAMSALIESADDAIISKTLGGIITSWNMGAERVFGYTAEEAVGQPVLMLIPPERHNEEPEIVGKIQAGQRIEHYQTVRRRKDGTLIDISLTVSPIRGANGKIIGASKIAREITDLKKAQQQLQNSEERYKALFESMDEGFCVIQMLFDEDQKPIDWIYLEVNSAFEKHNGVFNAEGKSVRELLPNLEPKWFEIYGRVALTGEAIRFEEGSASMGRWFNLNVFRVGQPHEHKVAVLFNDITERRAAEREREELLRQLKAERSELEAERSKLAYLFTKAPAFVATMTGPTHIFELTNPAYLQLIGHRDVIGKPVREALPEVVGQGFFELLDDVFQTGEAFTGRELSIQMQQELNGALKQRFVDFVYQPVFDAQGKVSGIFAHGFDITEQVRARKDAEESSRRAEEANRTKDEFLATLSHELRTPLTAIMGWTSILQTGQASPQEMATGLATVERNAKAQAQLIEDILDVSRVITGKMRLEVQPLDLAMIIEAAVNTVLPSAQAKSVRLQRVLDAGTSVVSGDPTRLQQVVWNLLANAIKFTPKGGKVQIRLERINSHVEIIVEDSGQGIAPEVLPHIFDRFRQADSTTTRTHGGLGLGLSIVRHLTEMHGGSVEAHSAGLGAGSTFTLKLPLAPVRSFQDSPEYPGERRVHPTAPELWTKDETIKTGTSRPSGTQLEGIRILVVDDQEDTRLFLALILEKFGATVTAVESAAAAFAAIQELRPDVLLSDIGMPEEDGFSLIKRVRALPQDEGGQTPAAALTAFARVEDRVKVLRSGFQSHLPKPVEPLELVAVVASLAGRHEA